MRWIEEFRDPGLVRDLVGAIAREARAPRRYALMEFCGGHTHALCRHGLLELLPEPVEMIHGPGCPVCVLPIGRVEQAIRLADRGDVTLCTYGDMMRVPGRDRRSLKTARAEGADVRVVYGPAEALALARASHEREVVFFAVGFETTAPATAAVVAEAARLGLERFSVLCNHVLTPAAMEGVLAATDGERRIDGFVGPGHVSAIVGLEGYTRFVRAHQRPLVVAGFEPSDLLSAILLLVRQLNDGRAEVESTYGRVVREDGNPKARAVVDEVMEVRPSFAWRGLGELSNSALRLREPFSRWDAERRFALVDEVIADHKACLCGDVLRGRSRPTDCALFGAACTPDTPLGACMVSSEGACAAYWTHGRARDALVPLRSRA